MMVARAYKEMEDYIRKAAIARNIDPDVAVRVAQSEALNVFDPDQPDRGGDDGSSFGLFQLHYGGMSKKMPNAGLGDEFTARTGLDARDPSTWRQQVDFSLDWAKDKGWGPWMGAKRVGIGPYEGISGLSGKARVSGPVEAAGGGAGSDVGATPLYNPGPVLDANTFQKPQSSDEPIALVPTRERTLADDFADAVDGSTMGRRQRSSNPGIIPGPIERQPPPEFEFASANAGVEGQAPPATAAIAPPLAGDASLADLFKVGDIGMAGKVDPVTGLPVLYQGRRAYG
jgi:hypothetical protein